MEVATGDIVLIQDADLEYSPDDFPILLEPIIKGQATVVYGSRFKGSTQGMTMVNRMANIFSNLTFNLLYATRLTDINTCYKVFKKDVLNGIKIVSTNFTFETEITAKLLHRGVKIIEVPIRYDARSHRQGKKIRWGTAIQMYWGMVKYRRG
jgi:glycosyltransferase involved in cell wall biosynthesis